MAQPDQPIPTDPANGAGPTAQDPPQDDVPQDPGSAVVGDADELPGGVG